MHHGFGKIQVMEPGFAVGGGHIEIFQTPFTLLAFGRRFFRGPSPGFALFFFRFVPGCRRFPVGRRMGLLITPPGCSADSEIYGFLCGGFSTLPDFFPNVF
jgi:hypothetical protein